MNTCFQQNPIVEASPIQDEIILFHAQTNKFCVLNRTLSFIWSHLQKPTAVEQIVEEICKNFREVTETEAIEDVNSALQEMLALNLVTSVALNGNSNQ